VIDIGRGVKLITRREWGARPPRSTSPINPTFGTTAHWEGPHMGWPWAHSACASLVRGIQRFHMDSRGWADIAYSGVACGHGFVFEGRWLGHRTSANGTTAGNNRAYAICYLGGEGDPFTDAGKRAMRAAFDYLDARGAGPGRNGHRDWKATACPGDVIYRWVRSGQPVPAPRPPEDEDEMSYLLISAPSRPAALLVAGKSMAKLRDSSSINNLRAAGVKSASLTTDDYDSIERAVAAFEVRVVED
jgi:hypothetical protein